MASFFLSLLMPPFQISHPTLTTKRVSCRHNLWTEVLSSKIHFLCEGFNFHYSNNEQAFEIKEQS